MNLILETFLISLNLCAGCTTLLKIVTFTNCHVHYK